MNLPSTPVPTLEQARRISQDEGLKFVYLGNVPGHQAESTYCPKCNSVLIRRFGFDVAVNRLRDGRCPACGHSIAGVWGGN